ncbi:MAG: S8 family serine peptidase [Christensenellaceae bacterium]|nr:S8 family serine peptidase [Christensenellaceae bacterium]
MQRTLKSILCIVLVAAMVFAAFGFVGANHTVINLSANSSVREKISGDKAVDEHEIVPIIVKLSDKPVLAVTKLDGVKSLDVRNDLIAKQNKVIAQISENLMKGAALDLSYHYTLLFNGFSFRGEYGLIEKIKGIDGVADCYRSNVYELPEEIKSDDPTKLNSSVGWINADDMWALGYTGQGQTIAVIDTGIKKTHSNFATAPEQPHFDAAGLQSILDQYELCAEELYSGTLTGSNLYYSAKIPFTFNYVTGTTDVSHSSAGSDHGTHVSSIAAGNDSTVRGVAYNAQIISMQVFQGGGAAWSTILAALEDCAYLHVDSINMSLGSDCGFTEGDADMEEVFGLLAQEGVNVAIAAGNSTYAGTGNNFSGRNPTFNMDNGVVSTPGTMLSALCIASSDNSQSCSVSSFSSWGTTSNLCIKPELMAPGGNIYAATDSSYSFSNYGTKSGTSMATPHIAGSMALVNQYVNAQFPNLTEAQRVEMVNTLLMSTAVPSRTSSTPYSPRQQGAGEADLVAAVTTKAYLEVAGSTRPKLEIGDDDERTGIFTLTFDVVNFGNTALTYTVNTTVLTENTGNMTVSGQTVAYMMGSPLNITNNVTVTQPGSITVPAHGRTTVTVTIDVNPYAATLNEKFINGAYIEGFVNLDGEVDLCIPYLGFYGDWEYASVLDREFYYDSLLGTSATDWPKAWGVNTAGSSISSSNYIEFGMNPFATTTDFLLDRSSISPNGDGKMDAVDTAYHYLLRNCEYFEYSIVDAVTGEEYYNYRVDWARKNFESSFYNANVPFGYYDEELPNWDGGNLPNGTTVILKMTGYMHSYDEFDPEANENASWEIPITIDNEEPEVVYWNLQGGQLLLYVQDNHYTSYVGVYSDSACTSLIAEEVVEEHSRGALSMLSFDVGNRDQVYVKVGDYAYNFVTQAISGEGGSLEPVELQGISFEQSAIETYEGASAILNIVREPANANNFEVVWTSGDPNIATVNGGILKATVHGVSEGTTTITATATDKATGRVFSASVTVNVLDYPTVSEALNVSGGNIIFDTSGTYAWSVDMDTYAGRVAAKSGNQGASSSSSEISTNSMILEAGDSLTFEWSVSSERNYDKLKFYVNGTLITDINGDVSWSTYTYNVTSNGSYTFKWAYEKDGSVNTDMDTGWLDNVELHLVNAPDPDYTLGDIDDNGQINIQDAVLALRYSMGLTDLTDIQLLAADVNCDGYVNIQDALLILRKAMGLLDQF